jgi:hypothetical protein
VRAREHETVGQVLERRLIKQRAVEGPARWELAGVVSGATLHPDSGVSAESRCSQFSSAVREHVLSRRLVVNNFVQYVCSLQAVQNRTILRVALPGQFQQAQVDRHDAGEMLCRSTT